MDKRRWDNIPLGAMEKGGGGRKAFCVCFVPFTEGIINVLSVYNDELVTILSSQVDPLLFYIIVCMMLLSGLGFF